MLLTSDYKLNSTIWLDANYTIMLYFAGLRAHEWTTKILLRHIIFEEIIEKDWEGNPVVSKASFILDGSNKALSR